METLLPIRRRASQHPRRANRSPRGTRPSCTLTARPCAASQKAATTPLTNHKKNPQPRFNRNQQYSITAVSDGGGAVVERYAYSAYGQVTVADASGSQISNSAISNRYTYTGREWDEGLSLYHYRARMYDAVGGRFVSRDPIGFVDGPNTYRPYFVLNGFDPSGTKLTVHGEQPQRVEMLSLLDKLCPDAGGFTQASGTVQSGKPGFCDLIEEELYAPAFSMRCSKRRLGPYATSKHPISCTCICDAINGFSNYKIEPFEIPIGILGNEVIRPNGGRSVPSRPVGVEILIQIGNEQPDGYIGTGDPDFGRPGKVRGP